MPLKQASPKLDLCVGIRTHTFDGRRAFHQTHAVQIDRVARENRNNGAHRRAMVATRRDGPRPRADGLKGRHERQRRHQHFRAAPVPEHGLDSQMQGGCPGIDGNDPARGHAQIGRHISLKLLHFLADAQVAVFADDALHGLGFGSPTMERESLMPGAVSGVLSAPPSGGRIGRRRVADARKRGRKTLL